MIGVSVRAAAAYAWPVSCQSRVVVTMYGCQEPQKFGGFFLKVTGLARHKDVGELTGISAGVSGAYRAPALWFYSIAHIQPETFRPTSCAKASSEALTKLTEVPHSSLESIVKNNRRCYDGEICDLEMAIVLGSWKLALP